MYWVLVFTAMGLLALAAVWTHHLDAARQPVAVGVSLSAVLVGCIYLLVVLVVFHR